MIMPKLDKILANQVMSMMMNTSRLLLEKTSIIEETILHYIQKFQYTNIIIRGGIVFEQSEWINKS